MRKFVGGRGFPLSQRPFLFLYRGLKYALFKHRALWKVCELDASNVLDETSKTQVD